jgi:polar amino acid transport system substrate-binding protein
MQKKLLIAWLILCSFGVVSNTRQAMADEPPLSEVNILYVNMPPYTYTDAQGRAQGILNHLTLKILQQQNMQARFVEVPLTQLFDRINQGHNGVVHLIGAFPVPKQQLSFSERPLAYLQLKAYYRNAPEIQKLSDLRGKKVIMVKGYTYGYLRDYLQLPENRVTILLVDSHEQAIKLLSHQSELYLLNYEKPFHTAIGEAKVRQLNQYLLSEIPIYWASTKENSSILLRMEQGLEALYP